MTKRYKMDYVKHYEALIEKAQSRAEMSGYTEKHHIVPRCIGGSDDKENLIDLTAEEHYVAHLLLAKIHGGKLWFAANMMANRNNKSYAWIKKKFAAENSIIHTGMKHTEESKKKMSEKRKNVPHGQSHRSAISAAKMSKLEYEGKIYLGYDDLLEKTGVSKHLYKKYYKNGIDPLPYVGNNTYAMVASVKAKPPMSALGKKWYNNGVECKYFEPGKQPEGWSLGRINNRNKNVSIQEEK